MKPKPRSATTFLTVPVVMCDPFFFPIRTADARSVGKEGRPRGARRKLQQPTHITCFGPIAQRRALETAGAGTQLRARARAGASPGRPAGVRRARRGRSFRLESGVWRGFGGSTG